VTDSATSTVRLDTPASLAVEVTFDGGRLTSDGGLPLLAKVDGELGLCGALAICVPEWRRGQAKHSLLALVRQRVYQIASGYEDQDDSDSLRSDPLLKLVCGSLPETGADLASQPTMSRLENAVTASACYRMALALGSVYIGQRGRDGAPKRILLDVDSTDDPTHGDQEGSHYHGYYRQHMYHPLLVFDGDTGQLITAILRPGNTHASRSAVAILDRIERGLRKAWPEVAIALRADAGFAIPAVYEHCEARGIEYTIGLVTNPRLEALAADLQASARRQYDDTQQKVRLLGECAYRAGSWDRDRRVVYKAEVMREGTNTRFVVTSRSDGPQQLYDWYVRRGESENWIKDYKLYCKADRLSCHRFRANQFRLLLHAAAYWLLDTLRARLTSTGIERMQLDTLRLRLIKIGGRVRELLTRVKLHLASSNPSQHIWLSLARSAHE